MRLVTVSTMRELDRRAITAYGMPERTLMELAGASLARAVLDRVPRPRSVLVLAGGGNNGGDGLACARHVATAGVSASVLLAAPRPRLGESAKANLELLTPAGVMVREAEGVLPSDLVVMVKAADVVVDGLLGTGFRGPLRPPLAALIEAINASGRPVVSADVPSGLSGDIEPIAGPVVRAERTVCMGAMKAGLFAAPGRELAGEVWVERLGVPEAAWNGLDVILGLEADLVRDLIPPRRADGHKGTYGTVLCLAGSTGIVGAAALAAEAALRVGSGLCRLLCPEAVRPILASKLTEVTVAGLPSTVEGGLAPEAAQNLLPLPSTVRSIVSGPGLGRGPGVRPVETALLGQSAVPMVIDADGLNALDLEAIGRASCLVVITPHPGEAARLLGVSSLEVQRDRLGSVRALATRGHCIAVLKGAGTLIADPEGAVALNPTGNDAMATGGTGDVLAGMVGGLLAQGASPWAAALSAVYLHGLAGDIAAADLGRSMLAGDLSRTIGQAFRALDPPGEQERNPAYKSS